MKTMGIITTASLSLLLGATAFAFAQQEEKRETEAKPAQQQEEKRATDAKPAQQEAGKTQPEVAAS
jgi:hypothetical protein